MSWCFIIGHNWDVIDQRRLKVTKNSGLKTTGIARLEKCLRCGKKQCYFVDLNRNKNYLEPIVYETNIKNIDEKNLPGWQKVI